MSVRIGPVLRSLAQHLDDLGLATYSPDGAYPASGDLPVVVFGHLAQKPIAAVAINLYSRDPDIDTVATNPLIRVQLAWRADSKSKLASIELADNAFDKLHTMSPVWPGGVNPVWMARTISAPAERDDDDHWIQADSYDIRLNPTTS